MPPDDHLTPFEHTRRALHRSADRILRAWPHALDDADARGYPPGGVSARSGDVPDPTGTAATIPDPAVVWLDQLDQLLADLAIAPWLRRPWPSIIFDPLHGAMERLAGDWDQPAIRRVITLANMAALHWPVLPKKGTTVAGVTVGARGNNVETCGLCQQPVTGGHADPIRRIDGQAYHGKRCWFTVIRQRQVTTSPPSATSSATIRLDLEPL